MDPTLSVILLFLAGMVISALGAMTGLGGGFLAVPFLVFAWGLGRVEAVLLSLTMIFANSTSSSMFYVSRGMADLRRAALMALPAIPGLFLGYVLLRNMPSTLFDIMFALLLFTVTVYILVTRGKGEDGRSRDRGRYGKPQRYCPQFAIPLSFIAGTASSAFGIGGGAVLMPLQIVLMRVGVKKAIATTMLVLAVMSAFRVFVISGARMDLWVALPLATGAVLGAQIGAWTVRRVKGRYLLYLLAFFLFVIAFYMGVPALLDLIR